MLITLNVCGYISLLAYIGDQNLYTHKTLLCEYIIIMRTCIDKIVFDITVLDSN